MKLKLNILSAALLLCVFESCGWNYFDLDPKCPKPSQPIIEYYNVNSFQYMFFSERITWYEAHLVCPVYNAQLATINESKIAKRIAEKIANSNIEMEDIWVGGHRNIDTNWVWLDQSNISIKPKNGYPPWIREPYRKKKRCLAMDRRKHDSPLFVDLDCRLPKPFMCQKKIEDTVNKDFVPPSQRITGENSTFILYGNKMTWYEAAGFCRTRGYRLAMIRNNSDGKLIAKAMVRSRPSFESMWIACYHYGVHWSWLSTAEIVPSFPDNKTNYPPWHKKYINRTEGCVLYDRHLALDGNFVITRCNRNKEFICEKYIKNNKPLPDFDLVPITYKNWNLFLILKDLSWSDASQYCNKIGSNLAEVEDPEALKAITMIMAEQISEPMHAWLGGKLVNMKWIWTNSNKSMATRNMPWCEDEEDDPIHACLNLDRTLHDQPKIYGLKCKTKQPFVCI